MPTLHPVDVSGRSGGDGTDGRSPGGEAGRASDGARGGDGRPGGGGADAGRIAATLAVVGGTVVLRGEAEAGAGTRPAEVAFPLTADDVIALRARGGDGGRGGDAGDGQDGGRGHAGADATRFSDGDDGGPGGDGGDAGEPADGGAAGRGGAIALTLDEHDMHALMALAIDLSAGRPGAGGRGGHGGAGGPGGPGGSGYSWTESYDDTETCTDSNGNTSTRTVTRTTSHHNSGGSHGPAGAPGRPSRRRATPGAAAPAGSLAITIDHGGRQVTYAGIYDLELLACTFAPVDERLFPGDCFEPGQRVRIATLELRNRGAMPTPIHQDITVQVAGAPGVQPLSGAAIPRAIPPGGQVRLVDPGITCRLADLRGAAAEPFAGAGEVTLVAVVGGIGRRFADTCVREFTLRSPVVLDEPELYTSLGPGERTLWSWTVRNQALLPFGAASPLGRALATAIHDPGGDCPAGLVVVERDGRALDRARPCADAIPLLAPGASATLRATFAFAAAAKPFTGRAVEVAFSAGGRDGGGPQVLQRRAALVKVAPLYRKTPEAAVLLITNHGTTVDEVDAWLAFLTALGLEANVFDLSHAGSVDLDRAWSPTQTLREEWRGRTVVALNNLFSGPAGEQSAADYLFDRQVLGSMLDDDIGWYAPGRGRPLITAGALLSARRRSRRPLEVWSGHAGAPAAVRARIADEEAVLLHVARRRWFHLQVDAGPPRGRRPAHHRRTLVPRPGAALRGGARLRAGARGARLLVVDLGPGHDHRVAGAGPGHRRRGAPRPGGREGARRRHGRRARQPRGLHPRPALRREAAPVLRAGGGGLQLRPGARSGASWRWPTPTPWSPTARWSRRRCAATRAACAPGASPACSWRASACGASACACSAPAASSPRCRPAASAGASSPTSSAACTPSSTPGSRGGRTSSRACAPARSPARAAPCCAA